jgi:large subunit ribosomal protein L25
MEQKILQAAVRTEIGKGPVGRLRKNGKIPAIVYGHKKSHPSAIDAREFGQKFKTMSENTIITIKTSDGDYDVLVKDYQEDLMTGNLVHIDFYEIERDRLLRTHIPLHIVGNSPGVREGGILESLLHEVEIECFPRDIPGNIDVDISELAIGNSIHISDIATMNNVRILHSADQVIVTVAHPKAEVVAEVVEEAVEAPVGEAVAETPED